MTYGFLWYAAERRRCPELPMDDKRYLPSHELHTLLCRRAVPATLANLGHLPTVEVRAAAVAAGGDH